MPATHIEFWAAFALLPLLFYSSALSRGKAAPKLRSPYAPFVLLGICAISVYFSGGLRSPLLGAYGLLTLSVGALVGLMPSGQVAVIATIFEFILSRREPEQPSLAPLALPWAGLVLGHFMGFLKASKAPIAPEVAPRTAPSLRPSVSVEALPVIDTGGIFDKNAAELIELAYHAHSGWNALLMLWTDGDSLVCRQARTRQGELRLDFRIAAGEGLLGLALRDKKPVRIPELAQATASALPYYAGEVKAKAILVSPFFDEGELRGLLVVDRAEAGAWSPDEEASVMKLGHLLVAQSQQAGMLGRVQDRERQLTELYDITKLLGDDLDRDKLVAGIPTQLARLLKFDSFYLALRNDTGGFDIVVSQGYAEGFQASYKLAEDTVLGGWVLNSGEPLSFNAVHASAAVPRFLNEGLGAEAGAFLLVPLMRDRKVSGLLKIDRGGHEAFTEQDKEVALIFATQAAVTLDNAHLYTLHKRMATTDGLTGLYNHRYFQERLALEIETAKRTGKPLSLALTDIDFFKKFNDTFGHQEGDNVLKKCSKLLKDSVRPGKDVVCRYGGEEFVIILPDCDLVEAREVVERVRLACAETLVGGHGPEARAITLSIGLCSYPLGAQEQRDIIHKADESLYKAKQTGRNRTCSYKDLP